MPRDTVFLSHANPEDNLFTRWLAGKLTQQGYRVFCDLIDFKGGEDFWRDAETAIRGSAAQVVFILSNSSNAKQGPLNELRVAANVARDHGLHDFIIPIGIDDLPARDANIEIARLNIIPAQQDWAAGLRALLQKFARDGVPQDIDNPTAERVPRWRDSDDLSTEVTDIPEQYVSNWFPIASAPSPLYVHAISGTGDLRAAARGIPWPAKTVKRRVVTFARAGEVDAHLPDTCRIVGSTEVLPPGVSPGDGLRRLDDLDIERLTVELYRLGLEQLCTQRGLGRHAMANQAHCLFFPSGLLDGDKVAFRHVSGQATWRKLVGHKSWRGSDGQRRLRYWHFGITARPLFKPMPVLALLPHVLFSDDGRSIWDSPARLHRARRSQCKDWWNDAWRDRLLAVMAWLATEDLVAVPMSRTSCLEVSATPVGFQSPVSFREPDTIQDPMEMDPA